MDGDARNDRHRPLAVVDHKIRFKHVLPFESDGSRQSQRPVKPGMVHHSAVHFHVEHVAFHAAKFRPCLYFKARLVHMGKGHAHRLDVRPLASHGKCKEHIRKRRDKIASPQFRCEEAVII